MYPSLPSNLASWKRVAGADPAANVEISDTVPTGKWWMLFSISVSLVQGLTQTPQPILVIDDGANVIFEMIGSSAAQAVSTTCQYTWAPDAPLTGQLGSAAGIHSMAPLPNFLLLGPGFRIRTSTLGLGANSNYGVPSYYVAELG